MKIEIMNQISKTILLKLYDIFVEIMIVEQKNNLLKPDRCINFLISSIIEIRQIVIQVTQSVSYFSYLRYTFELIINNKVYFIYLLFIIFCSFLCFIDSLIIQILNKKMGE